MGKMLLAGIAVAVVGLAPGAYAEEPKAALQITTTKCPGGTQGQVYAGCTIAATGGTPPYKFSINETSSYPPLPEGLSLNATSGLVSKTQIGGQGDYLPRFIVTDSTKAVASRQIEFAIDGANKFLATIFPSNSIFHHRVDAATTGLPVDTSPAAPIYVAYQSSALRAFFGTSYASFPNGIPAFSVAANQADVPVKTTVYQSYFKTGPIPVRAPVEGTSHSTGDRHVLIYREGSATTNPALYEMWQGIYLGKAGWTDSSNALWPDVKGNALTPQGDGTSDAAGLPVAPLLANADEVIGTGTAAAPKGVVKHPIRFTVNQMLNYWVWPATQSAGNGSCMSKSGAIPTESEISQAKPPVSCSRSGPAGEIYRLKASVATPTCAKTSPQAAILIIAFRDYGIILADNGGAGGLIGTPDARWHDTDLQCLNYLTLANFEPVNVSSLIVSNDSGETKK